MNLGVLRGGKSKLKIKNLSNVKKPPGGPNNEGMSVDVYENKRAERMKWDIQLTQVTTISCGLAGAVPMMEA